MRYYHILTINPGSTSTKIAIYENEQELWKESISHSKEDIDKFGGVYAQLEYRENLILKAVSDHNFKLENLDCVVGRGGLLPPVKLGGYNVNQQMIDELLYINAPAHASGLGCMIADKIAKPLGIPAYIYDAESASNLPQEAKITGFAEITRESLCHVLNSRAVSIKYATDIGRTYSQLKLVVAHMGGGVTVSGHKNGEIIETTADDDSTFSPERSGGAPLIQIVNMCYSGKYTKGQMLKKIRGEGGMTAHLGTSDARIIEEMIANNNEKAKVVYKAQALQIAKAVGSVSAAMKGEIDAIILTGGMAYSKMLTEMIMEYISFLAPVKIYPGENELEALANGALRILRGEETAKDYVRVHFDNQ